MGGVVGLDYMQTPRIVPALCKKAAPRCLANPCVIRYRARQMGCDYAAGAGLLGLQGPFCFSRLALSAKTRSCRHFLGQTDAGNVELAGHEFGEQEVAGAGELRLLLGKNCGLLKKNADSRLKCR